MTSQRADAYGRVIKAVDDLADAKLHADEQQVIRDAADGMFFCEDLGADDSAREALAAARELIDRLTESERLLHQTAGRLLADIEDCGPLGAAAAV